MIFASAVSFSFLRIVNNISLREPLNHSERGGHGLQPTAQADAVQSSANISTKACPNIS